MGAATLTLCAIGADLAVRLWSRFGLAIQRRNPCWAHPPSKVPRQAEGHVDGVALGRQDAPRAFTGSAAPPRCVRDAARHGGAEAMNGTSNTVAPQLRDGGVAAATRSARFPPRREFRSGFQAPQRVDAWTPHPRVSGGWFQLVCLGRDRRPGGRTFSAGPAISRVAVAWPPAAPLPAPATPASTARASARP